MHDNFFPKYYWGFVNTMNNYFIAIIIVPVSLYFIYIIHIAIKKFREDKKNKLSKKTVTR